MSCNEEMDMTESKIMDCGCVAPTQDEINVKHQQKSTTRVTKAESEAVGYLESRRIPEFFNFLVGHLVVERPDDPIAYLFDLLDKCMLFRSGLVEPPLLFTPRHIESLYKSLDPENIGNITLKQYEVGMRTLGCKNFKPNPMACRCGATVDKESFEQEAKRCLSKMLRDMIAKPQVCWSCD